MNIIGKDKKIRNKAFSEWLKAIPEDAKVKDASARFGVIVCSVFIILFLLPTLTLIEDLIFDDFSLFLLLVICFLLIVPVSLFFVFFLPMSKQYLRFGEGYLILLNYQQSIANGQIEGVVAFRNNEQNGGYLIKVACNRINYYPISDSDQFHKEGEFCFKKELTPQVNLNDFGTTLEFGFELSKKEDEFDDMIKHGYHFSFEVVSIESAVNKLEYSFEMDVDEAAIGVGNI